MKEKNLFMLAQEKRKGNFLKLRIGAIPISLSMTMVIVYVSYTATTLAVTKLGIQYYKLLSNLNIFE